MADFLAGLLSDSAGADWAVGAVGAAGVAAAGSAGVVGATGAVGFTDVAGAVADSPEVLAAGDFSLEDDPASEAA